MHLIISPVSYQKEPLQGYNSHFCILLFPLFIIKKNLYKVTTLIFVSYYFPCFLSKKTFTRLQLSFCILLFPLFLIKKNLYKVIFFFLHHIAYNFFLRHIIYPVFQEHSQCTEGNLKALSSRYETGYVWGNPWSIKKSNGSFRTLIPFGDRRPETVVAFFYALFPWYLPVILSLIVLLIVS
ncbi:hypothetical protein HDE70_005320 [Pedobacter cryoconitis]|nr:hypothetical protein [Pedobacter cryoconitis]